MKLNRPSNNWLLSLAAVGALLLISLVSGVGAYLGNQLSNHQATDLSPLLLHAGTAARAKSVSMATGLIDDNVEGLFMLDHATGDLRCLLLSPRNGGIAGIYHASVTEGLGGEKGGEADYVMTTGNFFFQSGVAGNSAPGNSICYVANTKTGKVAGFGLIYDKQAIRRGNKMQSGPLKPVFAGTFRGEQVTRDQGN